MPYLMQCVPEKVEGLWDDCISFRRYIKTKMQVYPHRSVHKGSHIYMDDEDKGEVALVAYYMYEFTLRIGDNK